MTRSVRDLVMSSAVQPVEARSHLLLLSVLLTAVQPGYEAVVLGIVERWSRIPNATFDGADMSNLAGKVLDFAERAPLREEDRLCLAADLGQMRWWCGLTMSDSDYARASVLVRRTLHGLVGDLQGPLLAAQPRAHALFVNVLRGRLHSASRGAVDYARNLLDDPAVERVRIYHRGAVDPDLLAYAGERLGQFGQRVDFRQDQDGTHLPQAITDGPYVHHAWCEDPLAIELAVLPRFGPMIMFTCGDQVPLQYADVYWYLQDPAYVAGLWGRRGAPADFIANYVETDCGPNTPQVEVLPANRTDFGLPPGPVVMITVGNRLSVDFDQPFVDGMAALLRRQPRAHWRVVGALPSYLLDALQGALGEQFSHMSYCRDLHRLFTATDLFVNPFRQGGGDSAMQAARAGTVVVTSSDLGDVRAFVPPAHRCADTPATFFETLERLVEDAAERNAWRSAQALRCARLVDQAAFTRTVAELSQQAFRRYRARLEERIDQAA